ncbi:MAG: non-canonical purine NTP pyrophosphatase [Myxococcales bacterium]|nr:non-canonical purine NTP pyrophosphatase [Myxococcales bacterium]
MSAHTRLLLATGNPGKLVELRARLGDLPVEVVGLGDLPERPAEVPETGDTFAANAILKAVGYGRDTGLPALADDSGLAVDALSGAPGVYSARFAGPDATDADNNALLLEKLADTPTEERGAHFCCVIALWLPSGHPATLTALAAARAAGLTVRPVAETEDEWLILSEGRAFGRLLTAPVGEGGFGYDPLFLSDDLGVTFAEASGPQKLTVSHRGRALDALDPVWEALG